MPAVDSGDVVLFSSSVAAFVANMYLAVTAAFGTSGGKGSSGLRLIALRDGLPISPGLARGLIRSAVLAVPLVGVVFFYFGLHDKAAGTHVVKSSSLPLKKSAPPSRKGSTSYVRIVVAILAHLILAASFAPIALIG